MNSNSAKHGFWPFACVLHCVTLLCLGCVVAVESSSSQQSAAISGKTMGTTYSVKCWTENPDAQMGDLRTDVDALLQQINQQMSTYLPDSELSLFNEAEADQWFEVSPETAFVVERALHFFKSTGGASDVTVGPLVRLWDFGPGGRQPGAKLEAPAENKIAIAKSRIGADKLEVRLDPPALRKSVEGLEVDLSSIAKGYAVDAVVELLESRGFDNIMAEIGGEVRAKGTRLDGKPWRIGVEKTDLTQRTVHGVVELNNQALATSGDYRNFRDFEGQRVSHIINPKTGSPMPYRGWSVTLLTPTCLEADALATALLVMGEEAGYDWCEEHEVAALFLIKQDDQIVEKATSNFPKLISLAP